MILLIAGAMRKLGMRVSITWANWAGDNSVLPAFRFSFQKVNTLLSPSSGLSRLVSSSNIAGVADGGKGSFLSITTEVNQAARPTMGRKGRFGNRCRSRLTIWCWLSAACPKGSITFSSPVWRLICIQFPSRYAIPPAFTSMARMPSAGCRITKSASPSLRRCFSLPSQTKEWNTVYWSESPFRRES